MSTTPESPSSQDGPAHPRRTAAYAVSAVLLLAPFVALLWVSSYDKDEPRFAGFPFFYWYQFLWVLIASVCTFIAYLLVRRTERSRGRLAHRDGR
jgi:hypothetical protein